MADNIETLLIELDLYDDRRYRKEPGDLERFERMLQYDEVKESIGDIDTMEEIARNIDSSLDGLLGRINDEGFPKNRDHTDRLFTPVPRRRTVKQGKHN